MAAEHHNDMQCSEFDALLSDALDKILTGPKAAAFQSHAKSCPVCGPLLAEAEVGKHWLEQLVEVDPPQHLVHNILAATSGIDTARLHGPVAVHASWFDRIRTRTGALVAPIVAVARQPRFAMSFGMAFFSLSVSLSLAGVKLSDIRHVDLRPSAIRRTYYETSGKVAKYYENIRFVYEIESRVREFKRATTPAEPAPAKRDNNQRNDNTSGQPDQKEQRNYSQGDSQVILASLPDTPPVVNLAAHRREL
ncbi:MAG: zf-HC2 domain-containing protein [Acidobacteriaceae bacterium]|nr:zf-HC2 domain-containing protein [Acidobacteriaceae bacterium]